jgi:hypothetical protein
MADQAATGTAPRADKVINGNGKRIDLAKCIILFAFGVILVIATVAIIMTTVYSDHQSYSSVKDILGMLLPVLSAWVGAVIAYYFSRDNYESATNSSMALFKQLTTEEKLKSILMKDVMILIGKAITFILDKPEKDVILKPDLIDAKLEKENKERLPILDPQGCIKYMVHRSLLDKFIVQEVAKGKKAEELTLQDMLDDVKFKNVLTNSFVTVLETSNLQLAKSLMDKIIVCSDVFATENGKADSKVLGWLTNIIVQEQSRI